MHITLRIALGLLLTSGLFLTAAQAQAAATLSVAFPGMSSVHTEILASDGVSGTATGSKIKSVNWQTDGFTAEIPNGLYDLRIHKGAATHIVDDVDCSGASCSVSGIVASMTVLFPGMSSVHTSVQVAEGLVTKSNWKTDQTTIAVFPGLYDLEIAKGNATHRVSDVDCRSGRCMVDGIVATMTVQFPGMSSVHTTVKLPDGIAGSANGVDVTKSNWKSNQTSIAVFPLVYDLEVTKGAATQVVDNVDCTSGACLVDGLVANLLVKFPGMSSVHTWVLLPDGIDNGASGDVVVKSNWKSNQTNVAVFRQIYDLSVTKGSITRVVDSVDCRSDSCTVDGIVTELSVLFPGMNSVHTSVRVSDGQAGSVVEEAVTDANWKSDQVSIPVFAGLYDLYLRQGGASHIVDDVDCRAGPCQVDGIARTLTVNFPGMSSVHTSVRVDDNVPDSAAGTEMTKANWKTDRAVIKVFPQVYDLLLAKGSATHVVDKVDCASADCTVADLTADLHVTFPGLSNVHTSVFNADGIAGSYSGNEVDKSNWKSDETRLKVFPRHYDLRLLDGGGELVLDDIDCTSGTCLAEAKPKTLTVNFPGMSSVHTSVRVPDGIADSAEGAESTKADWKNDKAEIAVLPLMYDLKIRKGAATHIVDEVDCRTENCTVDGIAIPLVVDFPGLTAVHTSVRLPDGQPGSVSEDEVTKANWKKDYAEIAVFPQVYDLYMRKGEGDFIVDQVDCSSGSCSVNDITAELVVDFPGLSGVHTQVLVDDGQDGLASGGKVTDSNWKSQSTTIAVFRDRYDVSVEHSGNITVADSVDCASGQCSGNITVADSVDCASGQCSVYIEGVVQATLIDGDQNLPLGGKTVGIYEKLADGNLQKAHNATTNAEGRANFSVAGLGEGRVYVLKTRNPFGNGKTYYSDIITAKGPVTFIVTADGENTLDQEPPVIRLSSPVDGGNVSDTGFTVYGSASDDRAVDSVTLIVSDPLLGDTQIPVSLEPQTGNWSAAVPKERISADQVITLTAQASDAARNSASDTATVTVIVDDQGPEIIVSSHAQGDSVPVTGFLLSGTVDDLTAITSLSVSLDDSQLGRTIDAYPLEVAPGSGSFTLAVRNGETAVGSTITLTLVARDSVDNESSKSLTLTVTPVDFLARHLLNRITFGANPALLTELEAIGPAAYLSQQLNPAAIDDSVFQASIADTVPASDTQLRNYALRHAAYSRRQLQEVMTWFWDNHFNTDLRKSGSVAWELAENQAFRANALGNFRNLLEISAKSPAMIVYLDGVANVKAAPNENYPRELLELHAMGVDNGYTQTDVEQVARAFTGWTVLNDAFFFNADEHDTGEKLVLGQLIPGGGGIEDGEQVLDILASHRSVAEFICFKLAQVFVTDTPADGLVNRCADTFQLNVSAPDQIAQVIRSLVDAPEFGEPNNYRAKIKTPIEMAAALLRNTDAAGGLSDVDNEVKRMGLDLFFNPVPTGYSETGDDWINSSLMLERIRFVNRMALGMNGDVQIDPVAFFRDRGYETAEGVVGYWFELTLGNEYTDLEWNRAVDILTENGTLAFDINAPEAEQQLRRLMGTVMSYPGYQVQ